MEAAGVEADLDTAVPCGLILNELITNSFKHAFPGGKTRNGKGKCEITVIVKQKAGECTMTVADNGIGLPLETDWENPETMGLRLVRMLSQQINAAIDVDRAHGTAFRLHLAHKPRGNNK